MSVALFIDANQYLDLFRIAEGRRLLGPLEEQRAHIFLCKQIVDEVSRNKLGCAQKFLVDMLKNMKVQGSVPDHLLGISDDDVKRLRTVFSESDKARAEVLKFCEEALDKISRSADDVSKRLEALFKDAPSPTAEELARARERRERGNPPGKPSDPLGDQIVWEQFRSYCKGKRVDRVWIVSRDQDYCIPFEKGNFLNALLYEELRTACGPSLEVRCFNNLLDGIADFGKKAGVKAKGLPEEEVARIRKELDKISDLTWITKDDLSFRYEEAYKALVAMKLAALFSGTNATSPNDVAGTIISFPKEPEK